MNMEEQVITMSYNSNPLDSQQPFKGSTYKIVSIVAYMIGVKKSIFENPYEPPQIEIYEQLENNKNARTIRNLCRLRTEIERNYKEINDRMKFDYKTILSMSDIVSTEGIMQLSNDGISVLKNSGGELVQQIITINSLISDRINNCKDLFPLWINWDYVKEIFIMPDGLTEKGAFAAAATYYKKRYYYPYQMYINWPPSDAGNILYNDEKFVTHLYRWNNQEFTDYSKVSDAGGMTKNSIYGFLASSWKAVMIVDCENSDPYKLYSALRSLDSDILKKITKIVLYDDIHTPVAWRLFDNFTDIPVEHNLIERLKSSKSLVDIQLTAGACKEYYQNNVDSFIIGSSDSDYWGLISSMPNADYLLMVERQKCAYNLKSALNNSNIFYCFIDDFYTGDVDKIQTNVLINEIYRQLNKNFPININTILDEVYRVTRVNMSETEKNRFYEKYVKPMHLVVDKAGNVTIELQSK